MHKIQCLKGFISYLVCVNIGYFITVTYCALHVRYDKLYMIYMIRYDKYMMDRRADIHMISI